MATCPDCDSALNVDEDDLDEGEVIVCDECGTEFDVVGIDPLELSKIEDEGYEDEDSTFATTEEED